MTDDDQRSVLPVELSEAAFELTDSESVRDWLHEVEQEFGTVSWQALGGIPNNVHTVEVASDPGLALVERPINGFDAELDLAARIRGATAPTPHAGAQSWFDVPADGLAAMDEADRRSLAGSLQVVVLESGDAHRPTIVIQDHGTGQHPDDFSDTLLSLLASNKKEKNHQMGVYNAGGAASCKFASFTIVISRLAPELLDGRADEIGVTVIRYNPLDPEKFKSGTYEYLASKDGSVIRLGLDELPELPFGTYVKLIEYQISKYARAAHEPKQSLWHLLHAALPDPPLPLRIIETRDDRFPGVRGVERRTVSGLLHLLGRPGIADYSDVRHIDMGSDIGVLTLRYFVLNEGSDPDAYTKSEQGLTVTLNGQRQITRDRAWVKRQLELPFLYKSLVVVVDGTGLTNATKRAVFSSTRESGVDSPQARQILERVVGEIADDENLYELEEMAKQRVLENATKSTSDRMKKQLATQIGAYIKGELRGAKGGKSKPRKSRRGGGGGGTPPQTDDSLMLDVPDTLKILNDPVRIQPNSTAALRLEINAKNGFLPKHADGLSVVFGPELSGHIVVRAKGGLLGGHVRVTVEAGDDAPEATSSMQIALVVPELGVLLTTTGTIEVAKPKEDKEKDDPAGGAPNIDISWFKREDWPGMVPPWDGETVGVCIVTRDDPTDPTAISKVEWMMNEDFGPYQQVTHEKDLTKQALTTFREGYEYPVLFGLFKQTLAEEAKEKEADDEGRSIEVPDDYVRGERARMARAVLMAMEPTLKLAEVAQPEAAPAATPA